MTLVVATAIGDTPDALYDAARKAAASDCDWIEVRLDGPSGLPWDLRSFFAFDKPCLATVRHADDGGRSHADDRTRAEILRRAMLAGAKAIDVETWSEEASSLAKEARERGVLVVVSAHLADTPSADAILQHLRDARAVGADHAKLATRVHAPADAVALVTAARAARAEGLSYAVMAVNDPFLRLLAADLGMALVYAAAPGMPPAAPGQVPVDDVRRAMRGAADITGATRPVFLLGRPVAHSKSPAMQNAAFRALGLDARYLALEVPPASLATTLTALRATNALGCNLTIPHKEAALALMDELDASAQRAGSVNTVVFRNARAIGHNTDGAGALDALAEARVVVRGRRALVLGAGGAGRAIAAALEDAGAEVTLANRTPKAGAVAWDEAVARIASFSLVVNATSVGLAGDASPVDVAALAPGTVVLDAVYGDTRLAREAEARRLPVVRGERMLLHQGARAFALWTGRAAPVDLMRRALEDA